MPIRVFWLWRWTNDEAACSAAASRFGGMSVAHMLRDTSIASTTLARPSGTATIAAGRAIAMTRLASPTRNRANGRWRRTRDDRGIAARTSDRLEKRMPVRRRRSAQMRATTSSGRAARSTSSSGQRSVIAVPPTRRHGIRPNQRSDTRPPTASSANPPIANSEVSSNGSVFTTKRRSTSSPIRLRSAWSVAG